MSRSIQEEILSVLWAILALLLWENGYKVLGIIALLKFVECMICSIVYAIKSALQKCLKEAVKAEKP